MSAYAIAGEAPRDATPGRRLLLIGIGTGFALLALPLLVFVSVRLTEPGDPLVSRMLGVETLLIAAAQVAVAVFVVRTTRGVGALAALIPTAVAGFVVATGDVIALSIAFETPASAQVLSVVAYDIVLGFVLAMPVVILMRSLWQCREDTRDLEVEPSAATLIEAYRSVLDASERKATGWNVRARLADQLLRRHIRQTLDALQRGCAKRAVERQPDESELRDRQLVGDYLLAVPPMSSIVPIPTVASVFVLWKLVPMLVAAASGAAAWFGGGEWALTDGVVSIAGVVPDEIASLILDGLALMVAFPLLMFVLAPAIHRRDELLRDHVVCEIEVVLMDERVRVPRSSRRREYVLTALPAAPFALYGVAVLVYSLAGLFVYPSPEGPLGGLVERADVMHVGPVTGAILSQPFLLFAAAWTAWIVNARKRTQVLLHREPSERCRPVAA